MSALAVASDSIVVVAEMLALFRPSNFKQKYVCFFRYSCSPSATISDALSLYDASFEGSGPWGSYAAPPLPPYLEDSVDVDALKAAGDSGQRDEHAVYDMCYHLLKLYADRAYPLHRVLAPTTSTPDHLDARLSWSVWRALQALEYTQLSDYRASSLCAGFAAQLETLGLWHWATFVLLHIQNPSRYVVFRDMQIAFK